jgi:phospholipid transport system substrate-binding protein
MSVLPTSSRRNHVKSRPTRSSLGSAIGIAVLLLVTSPKLAIPDSSRAPDSGVPAAEPGVPAAEAGVPATEAGVPAAEPGVPAAEAGVPAAEPGAPAAEAGAPATESGVPATESSAPTKVVDALHENLISVMKDAKTLGYDGRFEQLEPVIGELFDIPFMAEKSIGRYWKTVDEENRAHLLTTFERFTVANYAGRFTGYSGQFFETFKEQESRHGTVLVYSRLVSGNGETVQLNYRLRPAGDDGWRIIDVLLNGTVSELALRRSEYSSLIRREGFAALMSALNKRIDDLAGGKVSDQSS